MNNYGDLTDKVNGCAMKVHNTLGNGFQSDRRAEVIYQRYLAIELQQTGLEFGRKIVQDIFYGNVHIRTPGVQILSLSRTL
jgi:GxxExxY protein